MKDPEVNATIDRVMQLPGSVQGIAWSPDGHSLGAMQVLGEAVEIFTDGAATKRLPQLRSIADPSIAFVDDQTIVTFPAISSPQDALVDVWNIGDPSPARSIMGNRPGGGFARNHASTFCLSDDRTTFAAVGSLPDNQVLAVSPTTSWTTQFVDLGSMQAKKDAIVSIACSRNGAMLALGSISGKVYLVDTHLMRITSSFVAFAPDLLIGVGALAISPDGEMVATGPTIRMTAAVSDHAGSDALIIGAKVWHLKDGALLANDGDGTPIRQMAWSPTSDLVGIARDRSLTLLNAKSGRIAAHVDTDGTSTVRFRPDGMAIGFGDGKSIGILHVNP